MRKFMISLFVVVATMNMYAQIAVNDRGHVAIGHTTPRTKFDLSRVGVVGDSGTVCANFYSKNISNSNIAIKCRTVGGSFYSIGIQAILDSVFYANKAAAIYGTTKPNDTLFTYPGSYAGYFNGNMRVTGSTYSNAYLTSSGSIYSYMTPLANAFSTTDNENNERVSDKLSQLQAVQFLRDEAGKKPSDYSQTSEAGGEAKLSPIQYGLDPKQLKEVYPELVYEDEDGNVSINYVEMVPLLVQSINELSQELAELKGTSSKKAKKKAETTSIDETTSEVDLVRMDQNKPNPFSESTVITLNIQKDTQKANIFIYDMSGKQVKAIPVEDRGETNITVYASELTAGMYIYTLVVDGKVAVTRKMIVTLY